MLPVLPMDVLVVSVWLSGEEVRCGGALLSLLAILLLVFGGGGGGGGSGSSGGSGANHQPG